MREAAANGHNRAIRGSRTREPPPCKICKYPIISGPGRGADSRGLITAPAGGQKSSRFADQRIGERQVLRHFDLVLVQSLVEDE